jgi:hypothetical protein
MFRWAARQYRAASLYYIVSFDRQLRLAMLLMARPRSGGACSSVAQIGRPSSLWVIRVIVEPRQKQSLSALVY